MADAVLHLLDEPLTGVDAATQTIVWRILRELTDAGRAVVLVHHDLGAVRRHCDAAVLLNRRIVALGPVDEALSSKAVALAYGVDFES